MLLIEKKVIELPSKKVCEIHSGYYGEKVDDLKQIARTCFNGKELQEYLQSYVEHHIHAHSKQAEVVDITQLANKSEHELYVMEKYKGYKLIKIKE